MGCIVYRGAPLSITYQQDHLAIVKSLEKALEAIQEGNASKFKQMPETNADLIKDFKVLHQPINFLIIAMIKADDGSNIKTDRNTAREITLKLIEKYPNKFFNRSAKNFKECRD
tara:strand:+ start:457 stop:798 length:342 start_codon:yes stop_codon:yes gene_type:complete